MMSTFAYLWSWIQWLFGVVPLRQLRSPWIYRIVHYSVVVLLTLLLAFFSDRMKDPAEIDIPFAFVRRFWFGILFLLGYLVVRLVVYLISLLFSREEPEFADIEAAWKAGQMGLLRQGFDLRWLPTVLVNGLTPAQERNVFEGSGLPWKVISPPLEDRSAVLRFYANDDGLFISLSGVGAMAMQQSQVPTVMPMAEPGFGQRATPEMGGTLRREDLMQAAAAASNGGTMRAIPRPSSQQTMMPPGQAIRDLIAAQPVVYSVTPLEPHQMNLAKRRMQYLCDLLTKDRLPYCPVNGLIQAVPIQWAENQRDLARLCPVITQDLQEITESLQLQCPTVLLVTALEKLHGFVEFVARSGKGDPRFANSRAGSRFPTGAPIHQEHAGWVVERCLHWFRGWVYASLADDLGNTAGNHRLFRMMCELNDQRARLQYLLRHSFEFPQAAAGNVRLSGVYFAASGEGTSQQAFLQGVLLKILGEQNEVAWNPARLRKDQFCRAWATVLFVVAAVLLAANVVLAVLLMNSGTGT